MSGGEAAAASGVRWCDRVDAAARIAMVGQWKRDGLICAAPQDGCCGGASVRFVKCFPATVLISLYFFFKSL